MTKYDAINYQSNSGAQGEYSGLLTIRAYQAHKNESHRNICIIPLSAHGTNPASAVLSGLQVVTVKNTLDGKIDLQDLRQKVVYSFKIIKRLNSIKTTCHA